MPPAMQAEKLVKVGTGLELVEQWDWSLSLIYQCAKCLIHSTLWHQTFF